MAVIEETASGAQFIDREEGLRILEEQAQHRLGISGAEFMRRWDAGDYDDEAEEPDIAWLAMLIPLTR